MDFLQYIEEIEPLNPFFEFRKWSHASILGTINVSQRLRAIHSSWTVLEIMPQNLTKIIDSALGQSNVLQLHAGSLN